MVFTSSGGGEINLDISAEDNASGAIDEIAGSLGGMRKAAGAAGFALAGIGIGGLAKATGAAIDFEEAMVEVEKVTSTAMADSLEDDVRGVAESTRLAHREVAELTAQAARFGAEGEEEIANFTQVAAEMGAATTLASDEAGKALAKMGTALGVPMSDVRSLGDATNELSNNFAANSKEIVDSSTRAGQSLQALGLNEDQILGLSAAMNEVSPSSSKAATMMRKLSNAMLDPDNIKTFADALNVTSEEFVTMREESPQETMLALGEAMKESDEVSRDFAESLNVRQVRAFRRVGAQADTMREAQESATEAMEEGGSLAEENAADVSTLAGQMDILSSKVTTAAQKIGEVMVPALVATLDAVMPLIDAFIALNDKTNGVAGVVALAGTAVAGIATALAAVAPVITGTLLPALSSLIGTLTGGAGVASALGTVATILTGPVGVAIAATVAAVAGLWYAWDNNIGNIQGKVEDFVTTVQNTFSTVVSEVENLYNYVKQYFELSEKQTEMLEKTIEEAGQTIDVVLTAVINAFSAMANKVQSITSKFISAFEAMWKKYGDQIMSIINPIMDSLGVLFDQTFDAIMTTVRTAMALIRGDWEQAWTLIEDYLDRTFTRVKKLLNNFTKIFKNAWSLYIDFLKDFWSSAWDSIKNTLKSAFNSIVSFVEGIGKQDIYNAFKAIGTAIRNVFTTLKKWLIGAGGLFNRMVSAVVTYLKNGAKSDVKAGFTAVVGAGKVVFKNFKKAIIGGGGIIKNLISDIVTYFKSGSAYKDLKSAFDYLVGAGMAAFQGLYDGIIGNSIIKDLINDIVAYLKSDGVKSDLYSAMDSAAAGIYNGALNVVDQIVKPAGSGGLALMNMMIDSIKTLFSSTGMIRAIRTGAENLIGGAKTALRDFVEWALNKLSEVGDGIGNARDKANNSTGGGGGGSGSDDDDDDDGGYDGGNTGGGENEDTGSTSPGSGIPDYDNGNERSGRQDERPRIEDDDESYGGGADDDPRDGTYGGGYIPFASGGIVTAPTAALIGEAGQNEAVLPLDQLSTMMDTTYEAGATGAGANQNVEMTIRVEGDDELSRIIRENAEVVVEESDESKRDRLKRF